MAQCSFRGQAFDMLAEDQEGFGGAEWESQDYTSTKHIPGSTGLNSDVVFTLGYGAEQKTVRILLSSIAAWNNINSYRQQLGTLIDWDGNTFIDILLAKVEKPFTLKTNQVLCTCTFIKTSGDT
jgi:hypothetical protein